jgi:NADPH2:quinone reductase
MSVPATMRQIRSLVTADGRIEVRLVDVPVPVPGPDEVLFRVEATPINPSDLGTLFGAADLDDLRVEGPDAVSAPVAPAGLAAMAQRVGSALVVGNEGAGTVVAVGSSAKAQALLGRTVAAFGGGMYAEYRCVPVDACLELPAGTPARDGASCFVNPLTALGMVETMRLEGHTGLVHTAAASNLGRMLVRICVADGVPLVNVVRSAAQAAELRALGATHVCDSSAPTYVDDLTAALVDTGATIAFDAIGGGRGAARILGCMEAAVLARGDGAFERYGSNVHKQVYLYGNLDSSPTEIPRSFGMAWGMGGWLLMPFLDQVGPSVAATLRARVVAELTTTFHSDYRATITLAGMLDPDAIDAYRRRSTGVKYLVAPAGA